MIIVCVKAGFMADAKERKDETYRGSIRVRAPRNKECGADLLECNHTGYRPTPKESLLAMLGVIT